MHSQLSLLAQGRGRPTSPLWLCMLIALPISGTALDKLNEEKVVIAHVLRNFELILDEGKPIRKESIAILRPKDGLYLKLKHRSH